MGLGSFWTSFLQLVVSGALLLYMACLLHKSRCTLYCSAICCYSLKNIHNQLQHMYDATWTLPIDKCLLVIFLTYIKVIYFRTSPSFILSSSSSYWSGNNSSLSSSVTLFVSDSITIRFSNVNVVASIVCKNSKQFVTWYFPLSNNPLK